MSDEVVKHVQKAPRPNKEDYRAATSQRDEILAGGKFTIPTSQLGQAVSSKKEASSSCCCCFYFWNNDGVHAREVRVWYEHLLPLTVRLLSARAVTQRIIFLFVF